MVLARDLVQRNVVLLRYNTVLNEDVIEKIRNIGVPEVEVYLQDADAELLKKTVYTQDTQPDYDLLVSGINKLIGQGTISWAHPSFLCRDAQFVPVIEEVLGHVSEILTHSSTAFQLLVETRFLTHPQLVHCRLAMVYALIVGVELDYNIPALIELGICGMFYDIGKLKLPRNYLNKPGKLTEMEFAQVKKHTYFGRQMVMKLAESFSALRRVTLEHHESYFGGGYPRNIRGRDIHPFSQILALADKFSAMLAPRDYRPPFMPHQAYESTFNSNMNLVAPNIFDAFTKSVLVYPRSCYLKLSNGAVAIAVAFPAERPLHPTIEVIYSEHGREYVGQRPIIDLAERPDLHITGISQLAQQPQL